MHGINKAILLGTAGHTPDVHISSSGRTITSLNIATNEKWRGKNGECHEHTEWHRLTFFEPLSRIIAEHANQGTQLYIEGKLKTNEWEKDGVKRYTTEIHVSQFQFLSKNDSTSDIVQTNKKDEPDDTNNDSGDFNDVPF